MICFLLADTSHHPLDSRRTLGHLPLLRVGEASRQYTAIRCAFVRRSGHGVLAVWLHSSLVSTKSSRTRPPNRRPTRSRGGGKSKTEEIDKPHLAPFRHTESGWDVGTSITAQTFSPCGSETPIRLGTVPR